MDGCKARYSVVLNDRRYYTDSTSQAGDWLKHGVRHSRLHIESLDLPAYILPCSITVVFGIFKLYGRYQTRIQKPRTEIQSEGKPQDNKARKRRSDEESLADHVADNEKQHESSDKAKIPIPVMVQFFYRVFTAQSIATISSQSPYQFSLTCALQAISALCAGTLIDKTLFRPSVSLACGWLALFLLQHFAEPVLSTFGFVAVATLAITTHIFSLHPKKHAPSLHAFQLNATLLTAICCDPWIEKHSWLRRIRIFNQQMWPWAIMFGLGFATDAVSTWRDTHSYKPPPISTSLAKLKHWLRVVPQDLLLLTVVKLAVIFAEMTAVWVFAGYSTSCLGLKWLILGIPATRPAIGDLSGLLGGAGSMLLFLVRLQLRLAEVKKLDGTVAGKLLEARLGFEAVGWTVLAATLLAVGLMSVRGAPFSEDLKWTYSSVPSSGKIA